MTDGPAGRGTATRDLDGHGGGWDHGSSGHARRSADATARPARGRRPRGLAGVAARRAARDAGQLVPAAVVVLLAAVLAAAAPIYAGAAQTAGVRATVAGASPEAAALRVAAPLDGGDGAALDVGARAAIADAVRPGTAVVRAGVESRSFGSPAVGEDGLLRFLAAEELEHDAVLDAGRWPGAESATVVEAALPAAAAEALGLAVGDRLETTSRFDEERVLTVEIVGLFHLGTAASVFEDGDGLLRTGVYDAGGFVTYGPLVVTRDALLGRIEPVESTLRWWATLDATTLQPADLGAIRSGVAGLARAEGDGLDVDTGLPDLLATAQASAARSAGTAAIALLQLAVVAVAALLLVSGALADDRRAQAGLLRSRGAPTVVVGVLAGVEGALLALPAVLLAPLLAVPLVRAAGALPPPVGSGLHLPAVAGQAAWAAAALAAIGCVVGLAVPAALSARSLVAARAARARRPAAAAVLAAGADLALVALAVVGLLQLRGAGGAVGLDPVLVIAPTIGLVAAAAVCLRVLSRSLGLVDRTADRWAGGVAALGVRAVARRRPAALRSVALPLLAVAAGVVALTTGASWRAAQDDRADFAAGADVRVAVRGATPPTAELPGVTAATPLWRSQVPLTREEQATVVALDASALARVVPLRADLADAPFAELAAALEAGRPPLASVALPPAAGRLEVELALSALHGAPEARVTAVLRGADGLLQRAVADTFALQTEGEVRVPVPVPSGGPWALAGLELGVVPSQEARLELAVTAVRVDGATLATGSAWTVTPVPVRDAILAPEVVADAGTDHLLAVSLRTPLADGTGPVALLRATPGGGEFVSVPILATPALAAALGGGPEVTLQVDALPAPLPATIAGIVRAWPGTEPGEAVAVFDLATLAAVAYAGDGTLLPAEELLLAVDGDPAAVAASLLDEGVTTRRPVVRAALRDAAGADPVTAGLLGALALAAAGAAVAGALGFAVGARAAVRARHVELAALRALGLTARQVRRSLRVEQTLLAGFALVAGTVAGLVLAAAFVPAVLPAGVPPARLVVPWGAIGVLLVAVAGIVAVAAVLTARAGRGTASLLREGEDQ